MAMITCPECKKKISETADSCPNCGYKLTPEKIAEVKKKEQQVHWCITADKNGQRFGFKPLSSKAITIICLSTLFIFIFICFIMINFFPSDSSKERAPKTQEEIRKEQLEKQFSSWDGSHHGLTELIKKSMNDPKSYEHEETVYWDKGDYLIVKTTFRGKNAFGGVVKNWVTAKIDLNGNVIEIISQGE
jgi:hypothetical protein